MKKLGFWMVILLPLLLVVQTSLALNSDTWEKMKSRMVEQGAELDAGEYTYRYLSHIEPNDQTRPRLADYISAVGYYDTTMKFVVERVEVVSENWQIVADLWEIDQWLIRVSDKGEIMRVAHRKLIESMDGRIVDDIYYSVTPEEAKLAWEQRFNQWTQRLGLTGQ